MDWLLLKAKSKSVLLQIKDPFYAPGLYVYEGSLAFPTPTINSSDIL